MEFSIKKIVPLRLILQNPVGMALLQNDNNNLNKSTIGATFFDNRNMANIYSRINSVGCSYEQLFLFCEQEQWSSRWGHQKNRPVGTCETSIHESFNKRIIPLGFILQNPVGMALRQNDNSNLNKSPIGATFFLTEIGQTSIPE